MSEARAQILSGIRKALGRASLPAARIAELEARLAAPPLGPVPARARDLDHRGLVDLFAAQAVAVACTVARVAAPADVPGELLRYLKSQNLPARVEMSPDPALDAVPWRNATLLEIARGMPSGAEGVGVTSALAGVAETGTIMIASGPRSPATMNFLPETHVVVLPASRIAGPLEEAWRILRAGGAMPRTVNLITGPSRTGDIEQKLEMGAHGPRRLHLIVVEG